jgi:hypothetical protein
VLGSRYKRLVHIMMPFMVVAAGVALCALAVPRLLQPHRAAVQDDLQLAPGEKAVAGCNASILDAITITNVTVAGLALPCRKPFEAGDDWLQKMSIFVRNRTNKTIVYVNVDLGFPEAGNGVTEPYAMYMVLLGQIPDVDAIQIYGHQFAYTERPLSFGPGQTLDIRVGDYIDAIRAVVEKVMPLNMITKCAITLQTVYFKDGTVWNPGQGFGVPDPKVRLRIDYFKRGYFPGDKRKNWPPWL